jgi:hypothetical protein
VRAQKSLTRKAQHNAFLFKEGIAQKNEVKVHAGIEIVAVGVRNVLVFVTEAPGTVAR